ncbi:MAG: hypothetical protein B1H06_06555 [Candidatus Cloacimonas sp. 4484_143]|nr:MAG: hypothetical protein B1H06_06555 [Candidatus Cloacimonas sp. 4484_143]
MMKIAYLFVLAVIMLSFNTILAEEKIDDLDDYEIKTKGRIIQFVEKESKNVIHTINKVDDNPFMQRFEQKKEAELGVLDISINDLESIDIKQEWLDLIKDVHEDYLWVKTLPQIFFTEDKKYIVISYNLSFAGVYDEGTLFSIAHIFLYNCKGEQIGEAYFNDRVCGFPVLSDRAEYLGFKFEFPYDNVKKNPNMGFAVYDFRQSKLVVEDFVPVGFSTGSIPRTNNNQMSYVFHKSLSNIFTCHDFSIKKTYKKSFNQEKYFRLKEKVKKGLIFGINSKKDKNTEFISYENDFNVSKW